MSAPRWYIDTSDPSATALLAAANGQSSQGTLAFFHNDILSREIVLLTKSKNPGEPLQLLDVTGSSIALSIGIPDGAVYVLEGPISPSTPAAGSTSVITTGTSAQNAVFAVALAADSTGGSFQLTFGRAQTYSVSIPANTAIKANGRITCVADSSSSLQSLYFDLPGASSALVRFWINIAAGGTAPATPVGGSLQSITTITANDSDVTVAGKVSAVIEAHADFTSAAYSGATITWAAAAYGAKTTVAIAGTSTFTLTTISQGNSGQLDQLSFIVYDEDGSVAVWFDAASAGATGYPASAAAARRQIRVVVAAADTATTVATAASTAIDADGKFNNTTSSAGTVTIGLTNSGTVADGDDDGMSGLAGFNITTTIAGALSTYLLPWGATAEDLNNAFDGDFTAEQSSLNHWRITSAVKGAYSAPTLVESGLTNLKFFETTITVDSAALTTALATAGVAVLSIDAYMEVEFTDSASNIGTVLQIPCIIKRDLI